MLSPARYKMGTVSRLTGFSAGLLRIWERRYHLLEPHRTHCGHRLYSEDDLRLLLHVKAQLSQGQTIGEVARLGRGQLMTDAAPPDPPGLAPALPLEAPLAESLVRWSQGVADAAQVLDRLRIEALLNEAFAVLNTDVAVYQVLRPAAYEIGARWREGECSVAGEHLASGIFERRLRRLLAAARSTRPGAQPVICACCPGELHSLGPLVQAWELARIGYEVSWLGASLPLVSLAEAVHILGARAVYLGVAMEESFQAQRAPLLEQIQRWEGGVQVVLGGRGVPAADAELEQAGVRLDAA